MDNAASTRDAIAPHDDGQVADRSSDAPSAQRTSLAAFLKYFLYLGTVGFGGPIALVGYMQRDLVDERHWISAEDYKDGLALAQLAPGPLAAQLAMYLGWVRARVLGATLVGVAFIVPSFVMVLVLSALYVRFGGLPWMRGVFYGVGAAVIAIIARSALKLTSLTAKRDPLLWSLVAVNAAVTAKPSSNARIATCRGLQRDGPGPPAGRVVPTGAGLSRTGCSVVATLLSGLIALRPWPRCHCIQSPTS